jgi:PAS domain S-box-containing protein
MESIDDALHRKAEEILRETSSAGQREDGMDAQRLVHELRVHQIELELQNEELRETRARAEEASALYRDLYDNAPVPYLSIDASGRITRANNASLVLLDLAYERLVGMSVQSLLAPEARNGMDSFITGIFSCESTKSFEAPLLRNDASRTFAHFVGIARRKGSQECLLAVVDITEREAIDHAAREKVALIGELQHRVKNNLTVVYSLLGIGQTQIQDPKAIAILETSRARVMAMSHIYEQLYQTEEVLEVDLWEYLEHLIGPLLETYAVDSSRFRLVKEFKNVKLDAQRAALAGLMLSELISNATKYAYPKGASGELRVSLLERDGVVELRVADDGPGLPAGFDYRSNTSMGFTLLRMLSNQMRADLLIESPKKGGLSVLLRFRP